MDYLMIVGAAFLFSMQFLFTSRYEAETGGGWSSSLKFTLYSGIAGLAVLFIVNGLYRLQLCFHQSISVR